MSKYEDQLNLCWKVLPHVSRSFALCIKELPYPTDIRMMISYLMLRILDTIEDSTVPMKTKEVAFKKVVDLFKLDRPPIEMVKACREFLLKEIDHTYEHVLLKNVGAVMDIFGSFEQDEKETIIDCTEKMVQGMMKFQTMPITDFKLQEEYCYYVAGIVGHLDTRLFQIGGHINKRLCDELMESAKYFGIALQKVNILRDVAYDIQKKRYFWPYDLLRKYNLEYKTLCDEKNRQQAMKVLQEVVENALPYLNAAVDYVTRLPLAVRKVRIFCLIPLFMAIKSYAKCIVNENVFIIGRKVKIGKDEVRKIVYNSHMLASSNETLRDWYRSCLEGVKERLNVYN